MTELDREINSRFEREKLRHEAEDYFTRHLLDYIMDNESAFVKGVFWQAARQHADESDALKLAGKRIAELEARLTEIDAWVAEMYGKQAFRAEQAEAKLAEVRELADSHAYMVNFDEWEVEVVHADDILAILDGDNNE